MKYEVEYQSLEEPSDLKYLQRLVLHNNGHEFFLRENNVVDLKFWLVVNLHLFEVFPVQSFHFIQFCS